MPDNKKVDKMLANNQKGKKVCSCCHTEKKLTDFYLSYSPMFSLDKRTPVCKECCKQSCLNSDGTINLDKLKELLMRCDKPLYYDLISSAEASVKKENSYISDEEVKMHGYDVLSKFFTLIAMRQDVKKSFSDSEKDGFMHQNNNRTLSEKKKIEESFASLQSEIKENNFKSDIKKEEAIWSEKDTQNMNYVISMIGYNPFDDIGLSESDKKYCFNILSGYCDTDGITEDGNKMQGVIEMTMMYCQCKKITETMNTELSKKSPDDSKISKLTSAKSSLLSSISTIAKDNNIASNYNKNSKQGQNSLTSKMKEMAENGFKEIEVNLFDIKTAEAFKQIDRISSENISNQLTLDNNEYGEMVKEQREMIEKYEQDLISLREENRILKNKIVDLKNRKR